MVGSAKKISINILDYCLSACFSDAVLLYMKALRAT